MFFCSFSQSFDLVCKMSVSSLQICMTSNLLRIKPTLNLRLSIEITVKAVMFAKQKRKHLVERISKFGITFVWVNAVVVCLLTKKRHALKNVEEKLQTDFFSVWREASNGATRLTDPQFGGSSSSNPKISLYSDSYYYTQGSIKQTNL